MERWEHEALTGLEEVQNHYRESWQSGRDGFLTTCERNEDLSSLFRFTSSIMIG